jgi:hypothetical protein
MYMQGDAYNVGMKPRRIAGTIAIAASICALVLLWLRQEAREHRPPAPVSVPPPAVKPAHIEIKQPEPPTEPPTPFHTFTESVCGNEVLVYDAPPYPTDRENREHGIRWLATLYANPNDKSQVRVIRETEKATSIEVDIRGTRRVGWVLHGQVKDSCDGGSSPSQGDLPAPLPQ